VRLTAKETHSGNQISEVSLFSFGVKASPKPTNTRVPTYIAQKAAFYIVVMGADGKMILANATIEQVRPVYQKALELITDDHAG
jgi:hypothetical protein